jgi:adenine-specific DNA-methyltransferase
MLSNWGLDFTYPKPVFLIQYLINTVTKNEDTVLDFFAGSGTTAHAVMDLNAEDGGDRKWICVQLPETTEEDSEAYKAGYKTIADISRERIRRAGEKIGKGDVGFKSYRLAPSSYRQWREITTEEDTETLLKQSKLFVEKPLVDHYDERAVIHEILLKEGFDLNAHIEDKTTRGDISYYRVRDPEIDQTIYISFTGKITQSAINDIGMEQNATFVCFDNALDDTTKVNVGRNINIKTI